MLSPGRWHLSHLSRKPSDNLRLRRHVLKAARQNKRVQRALWEACRLDLFFFINVFVWQYNPQHVGNEIGPFITWECQERACLEIIAAIEQGGRVDVVIEKSREMGASWLCLLIMLWLFLFHPWKKFLLISRSADAVDKADDPDCLMWKLDFILEHLPAWLRGPVRRRRMSLRHLKTKSTITGQASTGKAGVGGRATAIFVDEFSQINEGFEVLHRTADTSGCRIFNFTHVGLDTAAYEMSTRVDVKKVVLHWSMHPEKNRGMYRWDAEAHQVERLDPTYEYPPDYKFVMDGTPGGPFAGLRSPWYDAEERRRASKRAVAMDLDIDPRGATSQFFDAVLIKHLQATYCTDPYWEGEISFDLDTAKPLGFVPRKGGPLKLWCHLDRWGRPPLSDYGAGADISAGTGATPSCLAIADQTTGEKVLEYTDPFIEPSDFAYVAVALCWAFKNADGEGARLAWEMQGPGIKFGEKVIELGYRNVYYRTDEFSLSKTVSDRPGWVPTRPNKRALLDDYRARLALHQFTNRSWGALDECLSYVYGTGGQVKHGKEDSEDPSGARENHGDHVIADALCNKMIKKKPPAAPDKVVEVKIGTLQWRRKLAEEQRRREESWA